MITVAMAEDHQMLIDGVTSFFEFNDQIDIVGTFTNGKELLDFIEYKTPEVVITDIRMPVMDGIELTKRIKKFNPTINVLVMTMFDQPEAIKQMLDAGATGYLLKNSGIKMLATAIEKVASGKTFFDPNVAFNFMNDYINQKKEKTEEIILSRREKEILELIAKGLKSREIAEHLFITKATVDTHRKNISKKFKLKGANELVAFAINRKYNFKV